SGAFRRLFFFVSHTLLAPSIAVGRGAASVSISSDAARRAAAARCFRVVLALLTGECQFHLSYHTPYRGKSQKVTINFL
ncbi:MAG: hypothetical protein ACOYKB_07565, partial [Succiniclasticum sp.]